MKCGDIVRFQSTPFARRETWNCGQKLDWNECFNPLPSQEGRLCRQYEDKKKKIVSIHSLRKKGDSGGL